MIEVREAGPEEFAAAGDVAVAGYDDFYRERLGSYAERLRDVEARARAAAVFVAVDGGEIVGTVTYVSNARSPYAEYQRPDEASMRMLSVSPARARRGVGRALSLACIERARTDGKRALVLHADAEMQASRALYEGLGFRRDPARDYRPDEQTALVCYVLDLASG